jgi:hypothetical protein
VIAPPKPQTPRPAPPLRSPSCPAAPRRPADRAAPLVQEVRFVAHEEDVDVAAALHAHLVHPPRYVQERRAVFRGDGGVSGGWGCWGCLHELIARRSARPFALAPLHRPLRLWSFKGAPSKPHRWPPQPRQTASSRPWAPDPPLTCHVVNNHGNGRVTDVRRDEAAEALLAGCVPTAQCMVAEAAGGGGLGGGLQSKKIPRKNP